MMIQTFMKMYNLMKMPRFIIQIYGAVKSASSNSTSLCKYHCNPVITAPYSTGLVSCSTSVPGFKRWMLNSPIQTCSIIVPAGISIRRYCTRKDDDFPRLTRLKCRGYPSPLASFSNFFLTYLVIKPHLDNSFSVNEFLSTTKKVVEMVSSRIVETNFEALTGLVTSDVLEEIKSNLPKFSVSQRQDLAVTDDELVYSFLDTISLHVDAESNTKSLEILTIHHAFKGLEEMKKLTKNFNPFDTETLQKTIQESKPRAFVLNYRFVRKFHSTGEADDWVINGVQHVSGKSMNMAKFFS